MKTTNVKVSQKTLRLTTMGILTAIMILMAFTPIGYIKAGVVEITLYAIPVAIGAILFGPMGGLYLGTVFGLTSFLQCFGMSAFGTTLFSLKPVATFILCMVPRMLMGFLSGYICQLMKKYCSKTIVNYLVTSFAAAFLNTVFFTTMLLIFFYSTDFIRSMVVDMQAANPFIFAVMFVGINGLVEMIATMVVSTPLAKAIAKVWDRI